ncbi:N/A [soil metagenome]
MKVAIVHEWLYTYAGAERVLEQMLRVFPQADLYSLIDFLPEGRRDFILDKPVTTSFIQHLPFAKSKHRQYLPLMPLAVEQFDVSAYDLIISNAYAVTKGVITGPDQLHISYIHSPMRYAWDLQHQYLNESGLQRGVKSWLARALLHYLRTWDVRTANGVDHFIANSHYIARRIWKVYRRPAEVIYPPVATDEFTLNTAKQDFYLAASRMVTYKRLDLIVETFSQMPDKRLIVIGEGPDFAKIQAKAGANVQILGYQPFAVLKDYMQRARAFVFASEEDFGIVSVEAQACGTPVIAYGKGGALETVRGLEQEQPTGVFFSSQTPAALKQAVATFEHNAARFDPAAVRRHAQTFNEERFRREFEAYVTGAWQQFQTGFQSVRQKRAPHSQS